MARRAVRFGPPLIFHCYFLCIKAKEVNERLVKKTLRTIRSLTPL